LNIIPSILTLPLTTFWSSISSKEEKDKLVKNYGTY